MASLENLFERLDSTREQLLMSLEFLPDEALSQPGVVGDWSIAGLLSVLTAWDAEVVTGLMRLKQGKKPEALLAALADPTAYNAGRYAENAERDLDGVFEDFQGARVHLEEWLEQFDDRKLDDRGAYRVLGGRSVFEVVAAATFKHEARYLPPLKAFAREWEAAEAEATEAELQADETFIPLLGLDVIGDDESSDDDYHASDE